MAELTRILLVDDDPLVRTGLSLIIGGSDDLSIVGEAHDGEQALEMVEQLHPDVVLMDIRMPVLDGLSATQQILAKPNPPAILVLTTFDSDDLVLRALQAGAQGFLLKDTPPPKMIEAIHAVAKGEPTLSPSVATLVIAAATRGMGGQRQEQVKQELAELTERELEVAIAIGAGQTNAEIATELYMSIPTVKAYVTRIFNKLGVDNRVQIAVKVHDAGLS